MSVTETEQAVDVDLDATVPCGVPDCDREATWAGKTRCPVTHPWQPVCTPHHDALDAYHAMRRERGDVVACIDHGQALGFPYVEWRPL